MIESDLSVKSNTDKSAKHLNGHFMFTVSKNYALATKFLQEDYLTRIDKEFKYRDCNQEDFQFFEKEKNESNAYYCVELKDVIGNIFDQNEFTGANIYLANCSQLYGFGIDNSSCINNPLPELNDPIYFSIDYITYTYDLDKADDYKIPVKNFLENDAIYNQNGNFM